MATFSVVPGLYRQLYTISYFREHHVFPCIFGLLKNKSFETYNFIFKTIMCLVGVLNPTVIKTDYEISAITALTSIWPNARINGCLFHLGQAIDRKIKGLNLSNIYATNFALKKFTRALIALAYVTFDQLEEEFLLLKEHDTFPSVIIPLYDYTII